MIQFGVVLHIDEELGRGAVGIAGTGHGDGAALVGKAVVGFVLDGGMGRLFFHLHVHTAALDHESLDHAVENGVGVEAFIHIFEEILHGGGSLVGIQFDKDIAGGGFQKHGRIGHDTLLEK